VKLQDSFQIPADFERSWALLQDIPSVANCLPGAQLLSVDGDVCRGRVKVKIGPIVMVYDGEMEFTKRDQDNGVMRMCASGRDKRGAGTVGAELELILASEAPDRTTCALAVDLDVTGKPAQFGRSAMQDVSSRLIRQFADNLGALTEATQQLGGHEALTRDVVSADEAEAFDLLAGSKVKVGALAAAALGTALATIAVVVALRTRRQKSPW
jgi:carbon monoxide dehydrogenase subunit G